MALALAFATLIQFFFKLLILFLRKTKAICISGTVRAVFDGMLVSVSDWKVLTTHSLSVTELNSCYDSYPALNGMENN